MKNKKGWIRLVEAFIALILIGGVLSIIIGEGSVEKDVSLEVYNKEKLILKQIQLNDVFRESVLGVDPLDLPVSWDDVNFPPDVRAEIVLKIPSDLNCLAQICALNDNCLFLDDGEENEGGVYVKSVVIAANSVTYSPKQLKLFCWKK